MSEFLRVTNEMYEWLPGGNIAPLFGIIIGFAYGLYRYIRSFQYIYYYYIEHGKVISWMGDGEIHEMSNVVKKHKLNKYYRNFGYIGGLGGCVLFSVLGMMVGTIWPVAVVAGVLAIPNLALRHIAKERRAMAIFEQTLKGEDTK